MKTNKKQNNPKPVHYNFPDPETNEEEMYWGKDAATCLHKAAEYEKWAERARSCGRNDLATLYEIKAEEWFKRYKDMEKGHG